jgi:hypothetical protein
MYSETAATNIIAPPTPPPTPPPLPPTLLHSIYCIVSRDTYIKIIRIYKIIIHCGNYDKRKNYHTENRYATATITAVIAVYVSSTWRYKEECELKYHK